MIKYLYITLLIALTTWIGILYFVLLKTDIATQKVHTHTINLSSGEYKYTPPIALVTYASGNETFMSNQIALGESALNKAIEHIYLYGKQNIDPEFYNKNQKILQYKKGAGFWLWKPYFILKTMEKTPDGAIILYADSGVVFSEAPTHKLLSLLDDADVILPIYGKSVPQKHHLKKEAQIALGIENNEKILNSQEIWAYFMAIRNNAKTRALIQRWLSLCENHDLLTDFPFDSQIQNAGSGAHLHDQSLLSVVVAQNPEHVKLIKRPRFRKEFGIDNFHRHPKDKYTSPKFHMAGLKKQIADLLYNNTPLRKIREYMD